MSQSDIIELLEKKREPLSVGEIVKLLNANYSKVVKDIAKMLEYGEILFKEIDRYEAMKKYNCRRRMRIYFVEDNNGKC